MFIPTRTTYISENMRHENRVTCVHPCRQIPVSMFNKMTSTKTVEPLTTLAPGASPYVVFPIIHNDLWKLYKKQQSSLWVAEEIMLEDDMKDWEVMSDDEKTFIKNVLGFFAASDGIVATNLAERFLQDCAWSEVKMCYQVQMYMEGVHGETYSMLIDKYVSDAAEKHRLFNAITTIPAVTKKAGWALKWVDDKDASFAQRLIAFAIVEGVFFSGSFCAIFWIRESGKMPGLTHANSLIARDEGLHTEFACELYNKYIVNKLDEKVVHAMVDEAVAVENEFINSSIPCKLVGMNAESMTEYIKFMGDRILIQLGYSPLYGVDCPFAFMKRAGLCEIVNFFEGKNSEYSMAAQSVADFSKNAVDTTISDDF